VDNSNFYIEAFKTIRQMEGLGKNLQLFVDYRRLFRVIQKAHKLDRLLTIVSSEFISVHPDIRLTSIRFNLDIQLIYPDNIRISRILSGYPKLSGYPGYLLKFFILSFVNDNLI